MRTVGEEWTTTGFQLSTSITIPLRNFAAHIDTFSICRTKYRVQLNRICHPLAYLLTYSAEKKQVSKVYIWAVDLLQSLRIPSCP